MDNVLTQPRAHTSLLKVVPLGGVGSFGMNCVVLECEGRLLVIDAGLKIPQGNFPGVDMFLPDFTHIVENASRVEAVVLTHGHDDHIGAVPFLMRHLEVPVYGTLLTLALVRERFANYNGNQSPSGMDFEQLFFGETVQIGPFMVEPVRVDHSIPDSAALIIRTRAGTVVHTGDFRIPQGHANDMERFEEVGREGVLAMLCDSTNADRPGATPPESEVARSMDTIMKEAGGRVFIAIFASHIERIRMVLESAKRAGRRVVLQGRRMIRNCALASEAGYLNIPGGVVVPVEKLLPAEEDSAVFLTTGSQGEPMSALSRIARGEHPGIKVRDGDTVVFSSRIIPGNELSVGHIIDALFRMGARVCYGDTPLVHVSGHGSAEEIKRMVKAVNPRYFIPVHGDYRQLAACADLAASAGVERDRAFLLDPGRVLKMDRDRASVDGTVPAGRMLVDGDMIAGSDDPLLRDRRRLAREGIVIVVASYPQDGAAPTIGPEVRSIGVAAGESGLDLDRDASHVAAQVLSGRKLSAIEMEELSSELKTRVRAVYRKALNKRPKVIPIILEE